MSVSGPRSDSLLWSRALSRVGGMIPRMVPRWLPSTISEQFFSRLFAFSQRTAHGFGVRKNWPLRNLSEGIRAASLTLSP